MAWSRAGACLIGAIALCVSGCGDSHDALTRDMLSAQKELCTILDSVQDDASAQAAATQLEALADRYTALKKRSDALGAAPAEVSRDLHTKYGKEFQETKDAVNQNLARIDPLHALRIQEPLGRIMAAGGK
jgi:hypothetical protein